MEVTEQVNAHKVALLESDVLELVGQVDKIYATRGKKIVFFDLNKEKPAREELVKALCPNGKLRAPALREGKTLIVGFDQETYARLFT